MDSLWDLCDMLDDEVKSVVQQGDISPTELDRLYKAVDIIKDIKTIDAMENADYSYDDGVSRGSYQDGSHGYYNDSYEGRRGRDGDGDGRYSERYSNRRGRDAMGRYVSRDGHSNRGGYSRDDKEQMMQKIEQMKQQIENM